MSKVKVPKVKVPTQKRLAAIDVFEQSIVATTYDRGGTRRKLITPSQAIEIFSETGRRDHDVTWLAFGDDVVQTGLTAGGEVMVLYTRRKSLQHPVKITAQIGKKQHTFKLRMPKLLAQLRWSGGRWTAIERVFAYRGTLSPRTQLYVPPLPNMYGDGRVCMGSVELQAAESPTAARFFEVDFLGSLFSDHLDDNGLRDGSKYKNLFDAIRKTRGNVPFSELKKVTTYGQLLKGDS